ncbi:hypothetical protein BVC71_14170 [Marivivens niveibacter]|uniref:Uncharacterized protein n=1 Tax=Marivivens niveibacter TaxID=1930667 RepID=A0A251WW73_9RHOB|nr:efflux RND transporter periplasmic adaptor subunit [Marivivens niveibacter]OUD08314.1 hypothetical protein BVC71_14170 [Marivivens niveibacter]
MTETTTPQTLKFKDEHGSSRSKWVAGLLALGLVGWMGSGMIAPDTQSTDPETAADIPLVAVQVIDSTAGVVEKTFTAEGQTEPDRRATLRARTSGEVIELAVSKGATVQAGDVIAKFESRDLEATLQSAQETLARVQEDFNSTQSLADRGIASASALRQARAELASAQASVAQAEEALSNAIVSAPFDGRLDSLDLELGGYVSAGTELGYVLDTDPLRVVVQIPQQSLAQIREGADAEVSFITGETRSGTIDYISRDAESDTRTFRAEITVPNANAQIASGLSAQVIVPTGDVTAHFLSPAILSLSEEGVLGIKTVTEDNVVEFHEVVIELAEQDGIWVSGLPETARIITIGQGFVSAGETVAPVTGDMAEAQ